MTRPRLLDLFAGAGGSAMGYHRAGFEVVGVDLRPQPRYPFEFHQGDALAFPLDGFDAVHASPPCHDHSSLAFTRNGQPHGSGWMLGETVRRLRASGLVYVVENVPGLSARAEMPEAFTLCGRSFGIRKLKRHRLFLTNVAVMVPPCACDSTQPIGIYGDLSKNDRKVTNSKDGYVRMRAGTQTARDLLDCQWMTAEELTQAIPPAYTEHVGGFLLDHIKREAA